MTPHPFETQCDCNECLRKLEVWARVSDVLAELPDGLYITPDDVRDFSEVIASIAIQNEALRAKLRGLPRRRGMAGNPDPRRRGRDRHQLNDDEVARRGK